MIKLLIIKTYITKENRKKAILNTKIEEPKLIIENCL